MTLKEALSQVILDARKQAGMTQEQLAEASNISVEMLSLIERGNNHPSLPTLYLLAKGLGEKPHELIRRIDLLNPKIDV